MDGDGTAAQRASIVAACACGIGVAAIGGLALLGYALDAPRLHRWITSSVDIMPIGAVAIIAAGCAVALAAAKEASARAAARVLASLVGATGIAVILATLFGDLGLDRALFPERLSSLGDGAAPGRPSLVGAIVGIAVAIGTVARDRRPGRLSRYAPDACAVLIAGFGVVALIGYAFRATPLYGVPRYLPLTAIALPSAVAFVLTGAGMALARHDRGLAAIALSERMGGYLVRRAALLAPVLPALAALAVFGERAGWFAAHVAFAVTVTLALGFGVAVLFVAARALNRLDELQRSRSAAEIEGARRAADALAKERVRLATILDQMPEGALIFDADGRQVGENGAARALRVHDGPAPTYAPDRAAPGEGLPVHDVRAPTGEPLAYDALPGVQALRTGAPIPPRELALRLADGRMIPIVAAAAPLLIDGERVGAVVLFHDVTDRKELERMREEWISVIAHDLRQPALAILLEAGVARRRLADPPDPVFARSLDRVRASALRLDRMVNDLLDWSRLEAKRLAIAPARHDLRRVVEEAVTSARTALGDRQVDVAPGPPAFALVDPDRIEQVLGNLLTNAVKYGAPDTPIEVAIDVRPDEVVVGVANDGAGLPVDELGRVFERFHRAPVAAASGVKGLGLGLYISKGLIEAHGGRIWAESAPGARTRFSFALPRVE